MLEIQCFCDSIMGENCYLVRDLDGAAVVIDPGFGADKAVSSYFSEIQAILLTHGHFDHIASVKEIASQTHAKVYLHHADAAFPQTPALCLSGMLPGASCPPFSPDVLLSDEDEIRVGGLVFRVLHTPGHTGGSVCYLTGDAVFTGDTVLSGSIGRTDFPTGDRVAMRASCGKIAALPVYLRVYPGHGEESTIAWEKKNNWYLRDAL